MVVSFQTSPDRLTVPARNSFCLPPASTRQIWRFDASSQTVGLRDRRGTSGKSQTQLCIVLQRHQPAAITMKRGATCGTVRWRGEQACTAAFKEKKCESSSALLATRGSLKGKSEVRSCQRMIWKECTHVWSRTPIKHNSAARWDAFQRQL